MDHRYYCTAPEGDHLIPLPDEHQDIVNLKRRINSGELQHTVPPLQWQPSPSTVVGVGSMHTPGLDSPSPE